MMPVGARGERAPALAPLTIMRVIRKGLIRVSAQSAIPMGASTTVVAMLPGPMAASTTERMKKMMGSMPTTPRDPLTAHLAIFSTVPLMVAMLNSSVAPTRIMKSLRGKNLLRSDTFMTPPVDMAMRNPKAMHMMPTLRSEIQLMTTATSSATRERMPRSSFLDTPPPRIPLRVVASDDEAGCDKQQSE